jgi:K+-sensing histidine kinase KdpD
MQTVLARLGDSARARGSGESRQAGTPMSVQDWLERVLEHWGLMWPQVRVHLEAAENLPVLGDESALALALESMLVVLLNNAAQVSPDAVVLRAASVGPDLCFEVVDSGGGFDAGKPAGWGVGLDLARAALARMGGSLQIDASPTGGVNACVLLPLNVVQGKR